MLPTYFYRSLCKMTRKFTNTILHFIASVIHFTLILPSESRPLSANNIQWRSKPSRPKCFYALLTSTYLAGDINSLNLLVVFAGSMHFRPNLIFSITSWDSQQLCFRLTCRWCWERQRWWYGNCSENAGGSPKWFGKVYLTKVQ